MSEADRDGAFSKRNHDGDAPVRRKLKKTAFFRPGNNLQGFGISTPENPPCGKSGDTGGQKGSLASSNGKRDPWTPVARESSVAAKETDKYDRFVVINQSSDESFEGVKWKDSPIKSGADTKGPVMPTSSPLKNVVLGSEGELLPPELEEGDQAESMLMKYGAGFLNIASGTSGTKAVKSNSDFSFDSSDMLEGEVPVLQRAKSLMEFKREESDGSKLDKWISKFDDIRPESSPEVMRKEKEKEAKEAKEEEAEEQELNPLAESSDPFSDEEEFMASVKNSFKEDSWKHRSGSGTPTAALAGLHMASSSDLRTESLRMDSAGSNREKAVLSSDPKAGQSDISANMYPNPLQKPTEYTTKLEALKGIREEPSCGPKLSYTRPDLRRYQILKQMTTSFKTNNRNGTQKIVTVKDSDNVESKLILRGEYATLNMNDGDIINLVITHPETPKLVDDSHNLLIWHPDVLVSATTVSQQINCPRKPVLQDRFQFPGDTSVPLLVGIMLHEIFQACFTTGSWKLDDMQTMMEELIKENMIACFSIECTADELREEMNKSLPYLQQWFQQYYTRKSKIVNGTTQEQVMFSVNKALDIEENIWSPLFGVKGKVDVTLEAQIESKGSKGTFLIPMEIKTGREYISHHAQSSLYGLLFKDRYDMDVNSFLLVYTKEQVSKLGQVKPSELRALINLRNRISEYLLEGVRNLPPVIKRTICERCDVKRECMTVHHLLEDGTAESSGLGDEFIEFTSHLNKQVHKDFYNYWDILITKEESLLKRLKRDLWVMTSKERETKSGKTLSGMIIVDSAETSGPFGFTYTLVRAPNTDGSEMPSLQQSQIFKHDRVMVSDEEGHFTIANATVTTIRSHMVVIAADRRITNSAVKMENFNKVDNQRYESVLTSSQAHTQSEKGKTFRIDKDEMFHGMGLARYNILNLFLQDGDVKRRKQIVELEPPRYTDASIKFKEGSRFNSDQQRAFNRVLSTEDYSLILGMPGTGKTTLIAGIINYLASQGKSVLLASYTHSAVDNILVKVKEYNLAILRVGALSRVHKDIRQFVPQDIITYEQYTAAYMDPLVVGVTCLGVNSPIFNVRNDFDYCIIDEASQVSFPISLGPLRLCKKFILVGDHNQLPPLVQHPDAIVKQALGSSLFQFLNDKFPESVTELTYQYRMCSEIMKLSNVLIYNNRLKCGSETVAQQRLEVPDPNGYKKLVTGDKDFWMKWVLNEDNKVIFLDHDLVPGFETSIGEKTENHTEAVLIWQIIESLTLCGVPQDSIGVMSLYRAQLRLLKRYLLDKENIEVMTADQFQGRDKDCVVISLVRSNKENKVGDLLQEWRRINVAITRSRSKLIIVGSKSTLSSGGGVLSQFMELVQKQKWMYRLPPNATSHYAQLDLESVQKRTPVKSQKSGITHKVTPGSRIVQKSPLIRDIINEI